MPPTPTLRLDRLAPGSETRLRQIRLAALHQAPEAFGSTHAETAARPPESWVAQVRDLPTWVAVLGGEDVGMVRCVPDPREVTLISLWVAPVGRGQGVGDALVGAVLDHARERGATAVTLSVKASNGPAMRLYARHGFVLDERPADEGCEQRMTVGVTAGGSARSPRLRTPADSQHSL